MSWRPNAAGHARLGLTVGRRAAPRASARNRVKRALREAFRQRAASLPPVDVVVLARPGCGMLRDRELAARAARLVDRLLERCSPSRSRPTEP